MKVSFIYRILFFVAIGVTVGFALGAYTTTKVLLNNLPPTTEVSVGRVKLKGRGNTVENLMNVEDASTDASENKTRVRRRDR